MAEIVGRPLRSDEHVHHKDGNPRNWKRSNLEILTPSAHVKKHAKSSPLVSLVCVKCGASIIRQTRYERSKEKERVSGPYCSKACVDAMNAGAP